MIENYLDTITNVTNYVDGILVVDSDYKVVYISQYNPVFTSLEEQRVIGKTLFELYPELDPESSTIVKALRTGKITLNNEEVMKPTVGKTFRIIDSTYPIIEDGKVIGAVSVATFPDKKDARAVRVSQAKPSKPKKLFTVSDIIGRSPQMQNVRNQVERISQTSSSVLIYGETGTGKELVAQSIHTGSPRKVCPFISQNCAAIPENLLESLFFGTTKGAYTGAEDKPGIFERAVGGTIFLDEINSMDLGLQAKLLRVLEDKKVTRIGGDKPFEVNVRIIAATNKDPAVCVRDGSLRPDLFYRLGGVTINLPPLKEREGDIELMTEYFVSYFNRTMKKDLIGVSQDVMRIFREYSWPGNVREFRNAIEGAFNLCEGKVIVVSDLPSYITSALDLDEILPETDKFEAQIQWLGSLKKNMDAYEKTMIDDIIHRFDSLSAAADYMGITRQALNQKMKKHGLSK